jgi:hypothetical protein
MSFGSQNDHSPVNKKLFNILNNYRTFFRALQNQRCGVST